MSRQIHGLAVAALLMAAHHFFDLAPAARAQGSAADYQRAESLRERTRDRVFRSQVEPRWSADGKRFWYRNTLAAGRRELILVNAENGNRRPAFDAEALAAALGKAIGRNVDPERLPIDRLDWVDGEAEPRLILAADRWFHWDPAAGSLEAHEPPAAPERDRRDAPDASRRTGEETEIVVVNRTSATVSLYWLDPAGRPQAYGVIPPGGERAQHTFAGHVWRVSDAEGRELDRFEAEPGSRFEVKPSPAGDAGDQPPARERRRRRSRDESPDNAWTAFVRDGDLFVREAASGQEHALSTEGSKGNPFEPRFWWSPDARYLLTLQVAQAAEREVHLVESSPGDQLQPRLISFGYRKPGDSLPHPRPRLFEIAGKMAIPIDEALFDNPWSIDEIRWAPDSSRFTFLYNQRGHQVLRVLAVDAASGKVTPIVDERSSTFIDYPHKSFLYHLDSTDELVWMSERSTWNHLYLIDSKTGTVKNAITSGSWVIRGVDRVDEEKREVWFQFSGLDKDQDPYHVHHARVKLDGTGLVRLTRGDGNHSISFSPDRAYYLDRYSRVDLPPVTELRRTSDGMLLCELERTDHSALLETGWRPPERFVARGRDGNTNIHGVIYRPSNFSPDRKYPVIEQIYAGPQDAYVPKSFAAYHGPQAMAELGFILVQIDGMGTNWRSKAFHNVCWKNLGDSGFPDRILWLQAAARKFPEMDLTRVGIYGGSAGGQSALRALLAHGDFYKAAVADCGCHDNRMDKIWWNELWMGWPIGPHYAEQSNVTQAHKLQGNLLLIVGELDRNVDPASTMQVVNALVKADRDFDLLIVPGAGHGAGGSPYGVRRTRDFFVRHLLGVEPRH